MPAPSIGPELLVNTTARAGVQMFPTVAATLDGRFVIAWHDISSGDYRLQGFNSDGTIRAGVANTFNAGNGSSNAIDNRIELAVHPSNELQLSVVYLDVAAGDLHLAEYTYFQSSGSSRVRTENVSQDFGIQAGVEESPSVAVTSYGAVVVGFIDTLSSGRDVLFAGYDPEFQGGSIHGPSGDQVQADMILVENEEFFVFRDVNTGTVVLQPSGAAASTVGSGGFPHIARLADGGLAVAWQDPGGAVMARLYEIDGTARTGPISVAAGFGINQASHICALQDGRILVVWQQVVISGQTTTNIIGGRLYNSDGTPNSSAFDIDQFSFPTAGEPVTGAPRAAQLADGRIVVTYQDGRATDADIKMKILDPRLEGVAVAGTNFADDHVGSVFDDVFVEGVGNDRVVAGDGNDQLFGGTGSDTLQGDAGNDIINGGLGADSMSGGTGDDQFYVDNPGDLVNEVAGQGIDRVWATASYALTPGAEIEIFTTNDHAGTAAINLTGNSFAQLIVGNDGNNIIDSGGGPDTLMGRSGDDQFFVSHPGVAVIESAGQGIDRVWTSTSFALTPSSEIETFTTTNHSGTTAINLTGNEFGQFIVGNDGANIVNGGAGSDTLVSRAGSDTYLFNTALGPSNIDDLTDFNLGLDIFNIDDAVFVGLPLGTLAAGAFFNGSAAHDADDRIIYNGSTGALLFDADGTGVVGAQQFANIGTGFGIDNSYFIVV